MKNHRKFFTIILGFTALLFVSSCSSNDAEEGNTRDALSAFVGANDNVVSFGNANLKNIMEKGDFKNVPKFGVLVSTEMETLESHIDMTTPVYYALEGPISDNGPAKTYAFVSIKNIDSLSAELTQRGFVMNKAGDMHYTEDGDFALGVKGKLGIIVTSAEEFDGEKLLKEALAMAEGDLSGGTVDEILSSEGDIVMGVSLENLYATSDTDLEDLSQEKQEEMKDMVDDSYVQTSFRFENGAAIIETKNHFSDALMARMFMKSDNNAPILAKLGKGEPKMGFSLNVDMKKMQSFVDDFSPNATKELARSMGGMAQMALMTSGSDGFASLFNGQFGLMLFGENDEFGALPQVSAFVGLNGKGYDLANSWIDYLSVGVEEFELNNNGLSLYTSEEIIGKGIKLPQGCEGFGKSGLSAFISFDGMDVGDITFGNEKYLLEVIDYVTMDYSNEGGKIYIKAKKGQENILKQMMKSAVDGLSDDISRMSI